MAIRPVQRIKHVVDNSATLGAATELHTTLAVAVDAPVIGVPNQVITGSKVNGIYLKIEVASNEDQDIGAIPNVYLIVYKNPGNNLNLPPPNQVGADDNKKFIIHQEMIMIQNTGKGGIPRVLFNGVVVIPKGYQRMGPADTIKFAVLCPQLNIAICSQAHYKEFR